MTIKSGPPPSLAMTEINDEFQRGYNLNVYRGVRWYTQGSLVDQLDYNEGASAPTTYWNIATTQYQNISGLGGVTAHGYTSGSPTYTLSLSGLPAHDQIRYEVLWHFVDSVDAETSSLTINGTLFASFTKPSFGVGDGTPSFSYNIMQTSSWNPATYSYQPWQDANAQDTPDGYVRFDTGWSNSTASTFTAAHLFGPEQVITDEACYLSHVRLRTRYGPNSDLFSSGAIAYYDFYGKARAFVFNKTISSDTSNYNLYDDMVANGWNEIFPVIATVTINSGVVVSSTSNSTAAFRVNSLTASSVVTINNNGYIVGRGGRGIGRLNAGDNVGQVTAGTLEAPAFGYGGPALKVDWATNVNNTGVIGGGGGAGGAGGGSGGDCQCKGCGGIGVGGFGVSGGAAGYGTAGYGWQGFQTAGQFGYGGYNFTDSHITSGAGGLTDPGAGAGYAPGTSGTLGVNGARGGGGATCGVSWLAPSDPANAGPATQGNANITWINTGTRLGNLD